MKKPKKNEKAIAKPVKKSKKPVIIAAAVLILATAVAFLFFSSSENRVAKHGDTVAIYFEGYLDGERFPGGTGNFDLVLGSGQFVPGFEEQLVGAKKGETREVRLRFPDQYVPGLAGQEVMFKVTINNIK